MKTYILTMKPLYFILLCLISGTAYSQEETPIYKEPAKLPFKDAKPTQQNGKTGLLNTRTIELLIPFEYDQIDMITDAIPYVIAKQQGNYGVLNAQGKTIIPFEYEQLEFYNISAKDHFEEALSANDFVFKAKKNGLFGFIDIHHKAVLPIQYDKLNYYEKGQPFPASKGGKWGIINLQGEIKVPFQYDEMEGINNAYVVKQKGLKGIISKEGKVLLPSQYTSIDRFRNSDSKSLPYYIITDNSKKGVWDAKAQTLCIPPEYDKIADVCQGNFIVSSNNKYGVLNTKNNPLLLIEYDQLKFLSLKDSKQPLLAMLKGKYGLIDLSKKKIAAFQYDDIQSLSGGFYKVCNNGQCKAIDAQGRVITKESYDHIGVYVDGEASVFRGNEMSTINTQGDPGRFSPLDGGGYTSLKTLLEAFVTAVNSKNDSIIRAFCKNVTVDKHTVSFLERSGFKDSPLLYDLHSKAYTLENIPNMWFDRLKRYTGKLNDLQYVDNGRTYLQSEQLSVESVVGATTFKAGNKEVKIHLGGLMRIDGIWKAFSYPYMAN